MLVVLGTLFLDTSSGVWWIVLQTCKDVCRLYATRGLSIIRELVVYGLGSLEAGNVTPRYQVNKTTSAAQR